MLSTDREEFDATMQHLCAAYNTPPTQVRKDAYWRAFGKSTIVEFEHLVDRALESEAFEAMPTVPQLRKLKYQRPSGRVVAEQLQDDRDHLGLFANRLLLKLMLASGGLGSINYNASPALTACLEAKEALVDWYRYGVLEEDESATPANFIDNWIRDVEKIMPVNHAAMAAYQAMAKLPEAQLPFPAFMGRQLHGRPAQLQLSP